jgi:hypothetical protein
MCCFDMPTPFFFTNRLIRLTAREGTLHISVMLVITLYLLMIQTQDEECILPSITRPIDDVYKTRTSLQNTKGCFNQIRTVYIYHSSVQTYHFASTRKEKKTLFSLKSIPNRTRLQLESKHYGFPSFLSTPSCKNNTVYKISVCTHVVLLLLLPCARPVFLQHLHSTCGLSSQS